MSMKKYKIAVLDDYQNVALESADWSVLCDRAEITVFQSHLADLEAVIERLLPFDVVCVTTEINFTQVGELHEQVVVTVSTSLLETESSALGQVIGPQPVAA